MLDLNTGRCRFILASTADFDPKQTKRKLIATKYAALHNGIFKARRDVEIIKIEGSVELAPLTGMADAIVDITETGTTLREKTASKCSPNSRLSRHISLSIAALKQKRTEIYQLIQSLQKFALRRHRYENFNRHVKPA